jgi:hypothetical protein
MKKIKRPKKVTLVAAYKSVSNAHSDSVHARILSSDFGAYFVGKTVRDAYEKVDTFMREFAKKLCETPNMIVPTPENSAVETPHSVIEINVKKGTIAHSEVK